MQNAGGSELNLLDGETEARMKAGGFVVIRFATECGGISSELAIEQSMMGAIKGETGLIRGHEFSLMPSDKACLTELN